MIFLVIIPGIIVGVTIILAVLLQLYVKRIENSKLCYPVDKSQKVIIDKNIVYKTSGDKSLLMDIYTPDIKVSEEKFPAVLFLHGEGIEKMLKNAKDWNIFTSYGHIAAGKGYAGITFLRNRTNMRFDKKDVVQDILDAVTFIRENADRWNIDRDRICLWGFSLGGLYLSPFMDSTPEYIKGLISYYGLMDVKFRLKELKDENKIYQPEYYLPRNSKTFPPMLVVKAANDKVKGVNLSIDSFMNQAAKRNLPVESICHSTGGHSFDIMVDNEETKKIIDLTWDFIKRNI